MLSEEDFAKFTAFRVRAMGQRLREMCEDDAYDGWTFEEKIKEMIDAEDAARQQRKIAKLVRDARFKDPPPPASRTSSTCLGASSARTASCGSRGATGRRTTRSSRWSQRPGRASRIWRRR